MVSNAALEAPSLVIGVPEDAWGDVSNPVDPEYLRSLVREFDSFGPTDAMHTEPTEIGRGASGTALFVGLAAVFLAGKDVNEAIDGWIKLAKRVRELFDRLRTKRGALYASESVALALAVDYLREHASVSDPRIVGHVVLPIRGGFLSVEAEEAFVTNPERFYVFVLDDGGDRAFAVVMKSTGELVSYEELNTRDFLAFHGIFLE
jgi:hypothetical protein